MIIGSTSAILIFIIHKAIIEKWKELGCFSWSAWWPCPLQLEIFWCQHTKGLKRCFTSYLKQKEGSTLVAYLVVEWMESGLSLIPAILLPMISLECYGPLTQPLRFESENIQQASKTVYWSFHPFNLVDCIIQQRFSICCLWSAKYWVDSCGEKLTFCISFKFVKRCCKTQLFFLRTTTTPGWQ